MIGIVAAGVGLPRGRWASGPDGSDLRTVAGTDEDTVTLAVAAGEACLTEADPGEVAGLYLATSSPPMTGVPIAALVARILGLSADLRTLDIQGGARAGTSAVLAALDAVEAGNEGRILVIGADARAPAVDDPAEALLGDGAAAVLIGDGAAIGVIGARASVVGAGVWPYRLDPDGGVRSEAAARFLAHVYRPAIVRATRRIFKEYGLDAASFSRVVMDSPDGGVHLPVAADLGFNPKSQLVEDPLLGIGYTGAADALLSLIACLEKTQGGERILWLACGGGADAIIVESGEGVQMMRRLAPFRRARDAQYLLDDEEAVARRAARRALRRRPVSLHAGYLCREDEGVVCSSCGAVYGMPLRVCPGCLSGDGLTRIGLGGYGKIHTFTVERRPEGPVVLAEVDLERGGRILVRVTDTPPDAVRTGAHVELVLRRERDRSGALVYRSAAWPSGGGR